LVYLGEGGFYIRVPLSRRGGIGRRARLKIWCPRGRVGSTPSVGTILKAFQNTHTHSGLSLHFQWFCAFRRFDLGALPCPSRRLPAFPKRCAQSNHKVTKPALA